MDIIYSTKKLEKTLRQQRKLVRKYGPQQNDPIPLKDDGGLDWTQVTKVRILGVEDTHG